jgi:hypothetical protein
MISLSNILQQIRRRREDYIDLLRKTEIVRLKIASGEINLNDYPHDPSDLEFLKPGSKDTRYDQFVVSEWAKIVEREDWRWFELGDFENACTMMPEEKLFEADEIEQMPFLYSAITCSLCRGEEISCRVALFCFQIDPTLLEVYPALYTNDRRDYAPLMDVITLSKEGGHWLLKNKMEMSASLLYLPVLALMKALRCTNVEIQKEEFPKAVNKRRAKVGKPLGIDKHTLVIKNEGPHATIGFGGTHASPRLHFRRGHIRRLKAHSVWVRQCLVGREGFVDKDYRIQA